MSQSKKINIFLLATLLSASAISAPVAEVAEIEIEEQIDLSHMQLSDLAEVIVCKEKITSPTEQETKIYERATQLFRSKYAELSPRRQQKFASTRYTGATEEFHGEDCLKILGLIDEKAAGTESPSGPSCRSAALVIGGLFAAAYLLRQIQPISQIPDPLQNQMVAAENCMAERNQTLNQLFGALSEGSKLAIGSAYQACVDSFSSLNAFQSCENSMIAHNATRPFFNCATSTVASRNLHQAECVKNFTKSVVAPVVVSLAGRRCWNNSTLACLKDVFKKSCRKQVLNPRLLPKP